MPRPVVTIPINARRAAGVLGVIAALLVLADLGVIYVRMGLRLTTFFQITRQFDLDGEANVPAFFSTGLFFINSALLFLVSKVRSEGDEGFSRRCWLMLAVLFCFLGIDENISIHEMLVGMIHNRLGSTTGVFYFAWVIPYGLATALLAALLIPWFRKLDGRTRLLFAASAVVYVSGALGMEMIDGRYLESVHGEENLTYQLMVALEETLEMGGLVLFAYSLMAFIQKQGGRVLTVSL